MGSLFAHSAPAPARFSLAVFLQKATSILATAHYPEPHWSRSSVQSSIHSLKRFTEVHVHLRFQPAILCGSRALVDIKNLRAPKQSSRMTSAYALPLNGGSHVYNQHGHGHSHSRSHGRINASQKSSSWISQISGATVKKTPSQSSLHSHPETELQRHNQQATQTMGDPQLLSTVDMRSQDGSDLGQPTSHLHNRSNAYAYPPRSESKTSSEYGRNH
jgi:hypothetical protein